MENIKFYNMNDINCWIINLKAMPSGTKAGKPNDLQKECVQNKIFGVGWRTKYFDTHTNVILDEETKKAYKDSCGGSDNPAKTAVDMISEMKCGDLVIMRIRDGHMCIGKITGPAFHDSTLLESKYSNKLSWMCRVEEWFEICDEAAIPFGAMGRLTGKRQLPLMKLSSYRQRLIALAIYETASGGSTDVPKITLNEKNFTRALSHMDLEDLVGAYVYNRHANEKYMLLPSAGKIDQLKYDFTFVSNKPHGKPITCLVKNNNITPINIEDYETDKEVYEKIYLFSENNNFLNLKIEEDSTDNIEIDNIEIISHRNLFNVLKYGNLEFMYEKLLKYYSFRESADLDEINNTLLTKGWICVKKFGKDNDNLKRYKVERYKSGEISRISIGYDGLYITDETDSFIIDCQNENTEKIKKQIEKDLI